MKPSSGSIKIVVVILDIIAVVAHDLLMSELKKIADLPEAQQKVLFTILRINKPAFRTSEVHKKLNKQMTGRSVGAVLGALYRNKYLDKVQGGRDKMWKLSSKATALRSDIKAHISAIKMYWS